MRKAVAPGTLCAALLGLAAAAMAVPVWMPLTPGAPPGTPPEIHVVTATTDTTTLQFLVHGFWQDEITTLSHTYKRLFLPATADPGTESGICAYHTTGVVGKSELPVIRCHLGIVSDATTVTLGDITVLSEEMFPTGYQVYPAQEITGEDYPPGFVRDDPHYAEMAWYPFDSATPPPLESSVAWWHHVPVAVIEAHPFHVQPAAQSLRVLKDFTVTYSHPQNGALTPVIDVCTRLWSPAYEDTIHNFAFIQAKLPPVTDALKQKLRIYVAKGLETNTTLADFILWKRRQGYDVTLRTVGSTGDVLNNATAIKNDIQSYYNTWHCYDVFVLFVGDQSKIVPVRHSYSYDSYALSDYKYGCVKGNDDYADLFVGRLAVDTDTELDNMLSKIMKYEADPPQDAWCSRAVLAAHKQQYPQKYTAACESIRTATYSKGAPTFKTEYGGATPPATNTTVVDDLEISHYGIVNYRGHGSSTAWSDWNKGGQYFNSAWLWSADNGDYTPVVFSVACHNNKFDASECFGEYWMLRYTSTSKGAVAHLGAGNVSYTTPNHEFDLNLFKQIFDKGVHRIGPVNNFAHVATFDKYRTTNKTILPYAETNALLYLVLGDPTLEIRTETPRQFVEVVGVNPIPAATTSYSVTVRDGSGPVDDAVVTIEKPFGSATPEIFLSTRTNASGIATFTFPPSTGGTVHATVSKVNYTAWQGPPAAPTRVEDWPLIR